MQRHVDILIAISEKHLHYSLLVKRIIIAIEAQLYFLGLVGLQSCLGQFGSRFIHPYVRHLFHLY